MTIVLTLLHIVVCLLLIAVVLLQTGKRADLAGAFGGGGSQTAFGARGAANALTKMTTLGAILFMLTSISLTVLYSSHSGSSVLESIPTPVEGGQDAGSMLDDAQDAIQDETQDGAPGEDLDGTPGTDDDPLDSDPASSDDSN